MIMRRVISLTLAIALHLIVLGQRGSSNTDLVQNEDFVRWVAATCHNEWDIGVDFEEQTGDGYSKFSRALKLATTDAEIEQVVSDFQLDTDRSYTLMAEQLVLWNLFKLRHAWFFNLSEQKQRELIFDAFHTGMNSDYPLWVEFRNSITEKIANKCGTTVKSVPSIIVNCLWDTVNSALNFTSQFAAIATAVNEGSWGGMIEGIKQLLKKAGKRLGWIGLAWAAIDVGICIWNNV